MQYLARVSLFVLGLLAGCHSAPVTAPQSGTPTSTIDDLASKTVALVVEKDDDGHPVVHEYCSGVWVSNNQFLTAQHCVPEDIGTLEPYVVREDVYAPGSVTEHQQIAYRMGRLVASDEDVDLGLVEALGEVPPHGVAHTSSEGFLRPGNRVFAMTHPMGAWWSFSSGDVSRVFALGGMLWIQSTVPIAPGSSGGGLFDQQGHLIGIAKAVSREAPQISFFVHRNEIDSFLKGKL